MKNLYMFFDEQLFEDFDLSEYYKRDICIPNTNVHIYEFECIESDEYIDDESKAKKMDEITKRLKDAFRELCQIG